MFLTMKFLLNNLLFNLLTIILCQIQNSNSISCFQCSLLTPVPHECPSSGENIETWRDKGVGSDYPSYVFKSDSTDFLCMVGVDGTKKVYYQVRLRKSRHANLCSKNQFFRENVVVRGHP